MPVLEIHLGAKRGGCFTSEPGGGRVLMQHRRKIFELRQATNSNTAPLTQITAEENEVDFHEVDQDRDSVQELRLRCDMQEQKLRPKTRLQSDLKTWRG